MPRKFRLGEFCLPQSEGAGSGTDDKLFFQSNYGFLFSVTD